MSDFKISLISPSNTTGFTEKLLPYENLGLGYLAAILRRNNFEVQILDLDSIGLKYKDFIGIVEDFKPDFIGLSPTWASINNAIKIIKDVRKLNHDLITCFGGYVVSFSDKEVLNDYPQVDFIIRGEGENPLLNLVTKLMNNEPVDEILGLTYRNNDSIIQNPIDNYIKDLDSIPFPERDTFEEIVKQENIYILNMITSRGCYWNCSFCITAAFSRLCKKTPAWRGRSIRNVIEELKLLLNKFPQIHFLNFADNNLFGPGKAGVRRVKEFARALIDLDLNIKWSSSARADNFDKNDIELLELLEASNVETLFVGIESGVQSQLDLFNKKITIERNLETIQLFFQYKMPVQWGYIMFNPYITFEELIRNAEFYFNELKYYSIHKMTMRLRAFPGTKLYNKIREDGLLKNDFNYINVFNYDYIDKKVRITEKILTNTIKQLYNEHAIIQNSEEMTDSLLSRILNINLSHDIKKLQKFALQRDDIYKFIEKLNYINYEYFRNLLKLIKKGEIDVELENNNAFVSEMINNQVKTIKELAKELDQKFHSFIKSLNIYIEGLKKR
ncbi:MAG: B12-binding domain-containing radical SAM protein [Promethearchaeota archaeon]